MKMSNIGYEKPSKIDDKHMHLHLKKPSKISVLEADLEAIDKKNTSSSLNSSPRLQSALTKPSRERWNCLCAPTTHAGSFRCRFHRTPGMVRGHSVGSNLSELAAKSSSSLSDLV